MSYFVTFDQNTLYMFQPQDMSHIFRPDLHERRQKRRPTNNNITKGTTVRSIIILIENQSKLMTDHFLFHTNSKTKQRLSHGVTIKHDHNHFRVQSGVSLGLTEKRVRGTVKQRRACNNNEVASRNLILSILDDMIEKIGRTQADTDQEVVEDNLEAESSLATDSVEQRASLTLTFHQLIIRKTSKSNSANVTCANCQCQGYRHTI